MRLDESDGLEKKKKIWILVYARDFWASQSRRANFHFNHSVSAPDGAGRVKGPDSLDHYNTLSGKQRLA